MIKIVPEPLDAHDRIEILLDRTFGRAHLRKTAQRLRDGRLPAEGLMFIAHNGSDVIGTIRFWHVVIGSSTPALLLGPMAIDPAIQGQGVGRALIRYGLQTAGKMGHHAVILVGDEPCYGRFGFDPALTRSFALPGPVARDRFLAAELTPGALSCASGLVRPTGATDFAWSESLKAA